MSPPSPIRPGRRLGSRHIPAALARPRTMIPLTALRTNPPFGDRTTAPFLALGRPLGCHR
ncbi:MULTISPECIES: hypothetical protein [unclassified Streptomyces]|uniref:hypothetical protein n=1 Tax=unclassified Streptomyces TaxID=2593676 RepID=UPI0033193C6A